MKNIILPCDCRLRWTKEEVELIMCSYHFDEYVDEGFILPAEEFIKNVTSPKGSHYSPRTLARLR
jgi:hypothetical protein